jgi:2-amino-4-hydroxy-6-hydroxymethyldihydropteridine diphosphokinase
LRGSKRSSDPEHINRVAIAYLSLGSNLGDREKNLSRAIELIEQHGIIVKKRSSLYETAPWGEHNQPLFLNMAVEIETGLKPKALLKVLKCVETEAGREKSIKWGPRIIDLDILLYNHIILNEDALKIPHPFMHEREFVLRPLYEIAPDVMHPQLRMTIHELFSKFCR